MQEVAEVIIDNENNKNYYLADKLKIKINDNVIVQTDNGLRFGKISNIKNIKLNKNTFLNKIIRIATKKDIKQNFENINDEKKAYIKCKKLIEKDNLNMNLIDVKYSFDRSQLFFNFTSDSRVDFRDLAKQLASIYKVRIELRQIGPRDKAKKIGGLGPCGRPLCCSNFLYNFNNITINMAKNQSITLNPSKINGVCNRLLCCLSYEDEIYTIEKKEFPKVGEKIKYNNREGKVISVDIITKTYRVEFDDKEIIVLRNESNK